MSSISPVFITAQTESRKRKRDEGATIELDKRPLSVNDPSNPAGRPQIFLPIALLSRAQLPLAYIDTSGHGSRLFSAIISCLEAGQEHGESEATVLVASDESNRLHAIERVKTRTYALCRLGAWVTEEDIQARSTCVSQSGERPQKQVVAKAASGKQPWWSRAAVETGLGAALRTCAGMSTSTLAMERVMKAPPKVASQEPQESQFEQPQGVENSDITAIQEDQSKPREPLQELASQYLETLYLSRMSLAYFAKGPLPRVRAALTGLEGNASPGALVSFLRESILAAPVLDKKYREVLLTRVKELPVRSAESPDKMTKRRKRKWKAKRDKSGFFVGEEDHVEKWWNRTDGESNTADGLDAEFRVKISPLRTRETFLQIILALEVLALEAATARQPMEESQATEGAHGSELGGTAKVPRRSEEKKDKERKKIDLVAHLDVLVDKLCIWHSLESTSPAKPSARDSSNDESQAPDELKNFCVEVIIPFYVSRLPKYATTVNRKLGGPSVSSDKSSKSATTRKPGEPAARRAPEKKPRRPLARVTTDTHLDNHKPPSLARSATDSNLVPRVKRESSEIALDSIPTARSKRPAGASRPSLLHSISVGKRQVDFSAMSQATEAKARKKAEVDEKLREAISTLKKPNRPAAVREVAQRTDETFAQATAKRGQASHPGAKPLGSIHVAATPKHVRSIKMTPQVRRVHPEIPSTVDRTHVSATVAKPAAPRPTCVAEAPPSTFAIPQTGHRPRHTTSASAVQETPSRGFARFMPAGLAHSPGTLDSTLFANAAGVQATPSRSGKRKQDLFGCMDAGPGTPSKSVELARSVVVASPEMARKQGGSRESPRPEEAMDVYKSLGWDEGEFEALS